MDEGSTPSSFDPSAISTSSSLAPGDRILAVKSSVDGIGWNDIHCETLESFVECVYTTTMHAYSFSKFIFLRELQDMNFRIQEYINKDFFKEVWLSLVNYSRGRARARLIIEYHELINRHLDDYLRITNCQRFNFVYAQQSAIIEDINIYTVYANNVHLRFGQHLRRAVNSLFRIRQRMVDLRRDLSAQDMDDDEIKHRIRQDTILPARTFKQAISQQPINMEQLLQEPIYMKALEVLQPVLMLMMKATTLVNRDFIMMSSVTLSTTLWPSINFLVSLNVLVYPSSTVFLSSVYGPLVTLPSTAIFSAKTSWEFDDPVLSILIQQPSSCKKVDNLDFVALFKLMALVPQFSRRGSTGKQAGRNHQEISGRCVAVDSGRREILYCIHENSTPEQPVRFRYTKQQQDKTWKTKKYRRILQALKAQDLDVVQAEQVLSQQPSSTVSIEDFGRFLQARYQQSAVLSRFYGHTITNHDNGYPLFRKVRLSTYFNKQCAEQKLIQDLRAKFGEDAMLVMGNWSAPHARYHEPIHEYKTSRCCPTCHNESLHTFRRVPNPRPYRRERYPTVICHGLLRCTNPCCRPAMAASGRQRLWNRDVAACLNYMHILRGLQRNGMVPHRFRRVAVAPTRRQRRVNDQGQPRTRIRLDDDSPS
ncbi:hypothetical protein AB4K20DRAFT_1819555 [Rhizopus microsporus]